MKNVNLYFRLFQIALGIAGVLLIKDLSMVVGIFLLLWSERVENLITK